ncbi:MAG: D-tyrosyl-tRNA(Tyr) deacylase [Verrucomicrobiales bacterium]|nr:D-tyrosyl-tRNA(Tyr) deacylase [Verrucomicrobiales bacterium]
MRVVVQRVSEASVTVGGSVVGKIQRGLLVLVGVEDADGEADAEWLAGKIVRQRIFEDDEGLMNRSVADVGGGVLAVSQFTLFASTKKGNRPSFIRSAKPEVAIPLYEKFVRAVETELGKKVETGEFGAMMDVALVNDGPVTICLDSKARE